MSEAGEEKTPKTKLTRPTKRSHRSNKEEEEDETQKQKKEQPKNKAFCNGDLSKEKEEKEIEIENNGGGLAKWVSRSYEFETSVRDDLRDCDHWRSRLFLLCLLCHLLSHQWLLLLLLFYSSIQ